jgi:hypothetical protein
MPRKASASMGLPPKVFLYTLDQVAFMLSMSTKNLMQHYLYLHGVNVGKPPPSKLVARAINPQAPDSEKEWRISEPELKRWLRYIGFRVYDRSTVQ